MISKELLSEVLKANVTEFYERKGEIRFKTHTNRADGWFSSSDTPIPNIYELAHRCKEWAFDKGFVLKSYKKQGAFSGTYHYAIDINDKICEWIANTEYEAIFKACEWINKTK